MKDIQELQKILGIEFSNIDLLQEALTHRSFLNEHPGETVFHNERLEFLGDAVLELVVTEFLFKKYPEKPEGDLTAYRAALVNADMLSGISADLKLGDFLRVSRGEAKDSGKGKHYILANTLEALIGGMYIDRGYEVVSEFIGKNICSKITDVIEKKSWRDSKSLFQERAQDIVEITPVYEVLSESGPDHQKNFAVGVYLDSELVAKGEGSSKQEAQMKAAENALKAKGWGE